jgi:hypothetical protein
MNGWPPGAGEGAVLLGLMLVVELVRQPLADLAGHRLGVHARRYPLRHAHDQAEILEVGPHGRRHAGILHLHRHVAAVVESRLVDLADRGRGHGVLVELGERPLERLAEIVLYHLPHPLEGHARGRLSQLRELRLDAVPELGRERAGVDERGHLADFHRRTLHLSEHVEDLLGGLKLAPLGRRTAPLRGARQVGRLGGVAAGGLAACQPSDLRRPADASGGELLGHTPHSTRRLLARRCDS